MERKHPKHDMNKQVNQKSIQFQSKKSHSKVSFSEKDIKRRSSSKGQISRTNSYRKNEKGTDSENNLSDFVSSDSEEDSNPYDQNEGRDRLKSFKKKVLKRILKNFDLEETIQKYICANAGSFVIDEKDFSLESSFEAAALRQRLVLLMGSNEVRTNDPLYAEKLRDRLWQEYEAELDRKEQERAEAERLRMRRLLKEGMITVEELKEDPLFLKEYRRQRAKYGRANPSKSPTRRRAQTAPPTTDLRTRPHNPLTTKPSHFPSPTSGYGSRPQTAVRARERPKTVQWERRPYIKYKADEEDYEDPFKGKRRPEEIYKYEHPQIKELREEETVDGLYTLAEDILEGKLPSQKGQTTKKTK